MDLDYAVGQIRGAVNVLATDKGKIKERLAKAHVILARVSPDLLPKEMKARFAAVLGGLSTIHAEGVKGNCDAGGMSEDRAVEIAKEICEIHDLFLGHASR